MDRPALVIDCTGMRCPLPIIELTRRLAEVEVDELIGVLADDPAARADVSAWCRLRGQQYVGAQRKADAQLYVVRRKS